MKQASILKELQFGENKPAINVLFDTGNTKEIRIALGKDQEMNEHKTAFPIVVEVFDGEIDFGVNGEIYRMKRGDLIALDGNVPHHLKGIDDSVIRLSLSKKDSAERVFSLVK